MKEVRAELLCIGDELLYGQVLDTNSHWMSSALSDAGIKVVWKTTVGDVEVDILDAFKLAESRADVVLISGGLGPTSDDLTKPCLAKYFQCGLRIHEEALAEVTAFFKSRGRELSEVNRKQAELPECCEKITNRLGTAPGMWFTRNNKVFVSMPGVPHELKAMMTEIVIPKLKAFFNPPVLHHSVIRTVGIGESFLAERIQSWEASLPSRFKLAYLPGIGELRLRLTGTGRDPEILASEAAALIERLRPLAGEYIYGLGERPLEAVVGDRLRAEGLTIAAAESCTGGYLSHLLTSIPGSSAYFRGSIIPYDNEIKIEGLGIDRNLLERHGAVSEEVVTLMAISVRQKFGSNIGVATSGIAGPEGGTPDKPVGTVWIALADESQTIARKLQLSNDRLLNIRIASINVLNLVRRSLPRKRS